VAFSILEGEYNVIEIPNVLKTVIEWGSAIYDLTHATWIDT